LSSKYISDDIKWEREQLQRDQAAINLLHQEIADLHRKKNDFIRGAPPPYQSDPSPTKRSPGINRAPVDQGGRLDNFSRTSRPESKSQWAQTPTDEPVRLDKTNRSKLAPPPSSADDGWKDGWRPEGKV